MSDELIVVENCKDIATWSDEKKKDFTKTFQNRVDSSRYILQCMSNYIMSKAASKKFISNKHVNNFNAKYAGNFISRQYGIKIGGREPAELDSIAEKQADKVLKELPPLKNVVSILTPDIAKKIEEKEKILVKAQKITDEFVELSEPIHLADIDQKMTVGDFRKMVNKNEKRRKILALSLEDLGKTGQELEREIDKALYAGIPGISDAVIKAASTHIEKSIALDQLGRRVEEQVMFGDSTAALELLRGFEKDEETLVGDVKSEFKKALAVLMDQKKQLKSAKK